MARDRFSDCGATDEEVVESLQEEFDEMQKTARAFASRCRDLEAALKLIAACTPIPGPGLSLELSMVSIAQRALK